MGDAQSTRSYYNESMREIKPRVAVTYVRVSTEEQAGSGLGLEAQRSAIAAAASRLGYELGSMFADGVSGALPRLRV